MNLVSDTREPIRTVSRSYNQRFIHSNKCLLIFPFITLVLMYHSLTHETLPKDPLPLIKVHNLSCAEAFQVYCQIVDMKSPYQTIDKDETEDRELRNDFISRPKDKSDNVAVNQTGKVGVKKKQGTNPGITFSIPGYTKWCRQRLFGCTCPPGESFDRIIGDCVIVAAPFTSCSRNQECQLYDQLTFCDYTPVSRHETPFCNCIPSAVLNTTSNTCVCKEEGQVGYNGQSSPSCYNNKYHSTTTTLAYSARANRLLLPIKIMMVVVTSILILVVIFCLGSTFYQKMKENMSSSSGRSHSLPDSRSPNGLTSPDGFLSVSSGSRTPDGHAFDVQVTNNNIHSMLPNPNYQQRLNSTFRVTRGQYVQTENVPGEQYSFRLCPDDLPPSYDEAMKQTKIDTTSSRSNLPSINSNPSGSASLANPLPQQDTGYTNLPEQNAPVIIIQSQGNVVEENIDKHLTT